MPRSGFISCHQRVQALLSPWFCTACSVLNERAGSQQRSEFSCSGAASTAPRQAVAIPKMEILPVVLELQCTIQMACVKQPQASVLLPQRANKCKKSHKWKHLTRNHCRQGMPLESSSRSTAHPKYSIGFLLVFPNKSTFEQVKNL